MMPTITFDAVPVDSSSTSATAAGGTLDSTGSVAPHRHVATLRGTRRPHDGQALPNPV
jgi:hypothetical protein